MPVSKKEFVIDGSRCLSLAETVKEFNSALGLSSLWQGNLDAFNDILNGGFGTPEDGFILVWTGSEIARKNLGYPETVRWYEKTLKICHPSNVADLNQKLNQAREGKGQTLFDWLIEIIKSHDDIQLRLK